MKKSIFKYFFATLFAGFCGILYQTLVQKSPTAQFSQFFNPKNQTQSASGLAVLDRAARIKSFEESSKADEVEIPVVYEQFDQPVGYVAPAQTKKASGVHVDPNVAFSTINKLQSSDFAQAPIANFADNFPQPQPYDDFYYPYHDSGLRGRRAKDQQPAKFSKTEESQPTPQATKTEPEKEKKNKNEYPFRHKKFKKYRHDRDDKDFEDTFDDFADEEDAEEVPTEESTKPSVKPTTPWWEKFVWILPTLYNLYEWWNKFFDSKPEPKVEPKPNADNNDDTDDTTDDYDDDEDDDIKDEPEVAQEQPKGEKPEPKVEPKPQEDNNEDTDDYDDDIEDEPADTHAEPFRPDRPSARMPKPRGFMPEEEQEPIRQQQKQPRKSATRPATPTELPEEQIPRQSRMSSSRPATPTELPEEIPVTGSQPADLSTEPSRQNVGPGGKKFKPFDAGVRPVRLQESTGTSTPVAQVQHPGATQPRNEIPVMPETTGQRRAQPLRPTQQAPELPEPVIVEIINPEDIEILESSENLGEPERQAKIEKVSGTTLDAGTNLPALQGQGISVADQPQQSKKEIIETHPRSVTVQLPETTQAPRRRALPADKPVHPNLLPQEPATTFLPLPTEINIADMPQRNIESLQPGSQKIIARLREEPTQLELPNVVEEELVQPMPAIETLEEQLTELPQNIVSKKDNLKLKKITPEEQLKLDIAQDMEILGFRPQMESKPYQERSMMDPIDTIYFIKDPMSGNTLYGTSNEWDQFEQVLNPKPKIQPKITKIDEKSLWQRTKHAISSLEQKVGDFFATNPEAVSALTTLTQDIQQVPEPLPAPTEKEVVSKLSKKDVRPKLTDEELIEQAMKNLKFDTLPIEYVVPALAPAPPLTHVESLKEALKRIPTQARTVRLIP